MCGVCGCGKAETTVEGEGAHDHGHGHGHAHDASSGPRLIEVEEELLAQNDLVAKDNRARFAAGRTFVLNLMSSPGSGKTTLLCALLKRLHGRLPLAVIEGDQQTSFDADRIRETHVPAIQVNTGTGCHLDAAMVKRALSQLPAPDAGILFVENVGNLVCPAGFDLGENLRAVVVSVTEGEDKPLKYPHMFRAADLVVVNKVDLLPHLDFDVEQLEDNIRALAKDAAILRASATRGQGMDALEAFIMESARAVIEATPELEMIIAP